MAEKDAVSIIEALSTVNDIPETLRADAYEGGSAPSAISLGAEGITTFAGFDRRNGSATAVTWLGDELARELARPSENGKAGPPANQSAADSAEG
jgi:hypothetical protein